MESPNPVGHAACIGSPTGQMAPRPARGTLVAAVRAGPDDSVLDVATGTGMLARALESRYGCRVIGLDQSADMLAAGSEDRRPPGQHCPADEPRWRHGDERHKIRPKRAANSLEHRQRG